MREIFLARRGNARRSKTRRRNAKSGKAGGAVASLGQAGLSSAVQGDVLHGWSQTGKTRRGKVWCDTFVVRQGRRGPARPVGVLIGTTCLGNAKLCVCLVGQGSARRDEALSVKARQANARLGRSWSCMAQQCGACLRLAVLGRSGQRESRQARRGTEVWQGRQRWSKSMFGSARHLQLSGSATRDTAGKDGMERLARHGGSRRSMVGQGRRSMAVQVLCAEQQVCVHRRSAWQRRPVSVRRVAVWRSNARLSETCSGSALLGRHGPARLGWSSRGSSRHSRAMRGTSLLGKAKQAWFGMALLRRGAELCGPLRQRLFFAVLGEAGPVRHGSPSLGVGGRGWAAQSAARQARQGWAECGRDRYVSSRLCATRLVEAGRVRLVTVRQVRHGDTLLGQFQRGDARPASAQCGSARQAGSGGARRRSALASLGMLRSGPAAHGNAGSAGRDAVWRSAAQYGSSVRASLGRRGLLGRAVVSHGKARQGRRGSSVPEAWQSTARPGFGKARWWRVKAGSAGFRLCLAGHGTT